jgi:predicted peroxiredoxin
MSEQEKIVCIVTHAGEDPERATLPFVLATASQVMEVEAVIVLQGTGVMLATKGYAEHVHAGALPPVKSLIDTFVAEGGRILVCGPCIKERRIEESDLIEGASVTAAGNLVQELLTANSTLVY